MLQNKNRPGFTLIEIIIVVTITLFLLVATVQGFVNSSSQFTFSNEAEKIQAMIRTARSLAISGKAQPDYTDFNKNTCVDAGGPNVDPCPPEGEFVTPAHYGVIFRKMPAGDAVTLFVDNHSATPNNEGKYEDGGGVGGYKLGKDFFLDSFTLPKGMQLILPNADIEDTIFFSPIFADVSADPSLDPIAPFFTYGISQKQGTIVRKRCWQIHMLSGISEPMTEGATPDEDKCP